MGTGTSGLLDFNSSHPISATGTCTSGPVPIKEWKRYVDDVFSIIPKGKRDILLNYLNSIDQHIKFTVEQPNPEGAIPFLATFPQPKGENISVSVYRKPTHTDRYLDFNSNHPISATGTCTSGPVPIKEWKRYVDDVFSITPNGKRGIPYHSWTHSPNQKVRIFLYLSTGNLLTQTGIWTSIPVTQYLPQVLVILDLYPSRNGKGMWMMSSVLSPKVKETFCLIISIP